MESLLQGIAGVVDYVLVTSTTNEEHLKSLELVLKWMEAGLFLKIEKY